MFTNQSHFMTSFSSKKRGNKQQIPHKFSYKWHHILNTFDVLHYWLATTWMINKLVFPHFSPCLSL